MTAQQLDLLDLIPAPCAAAHPLGRGTYDCTRDAGHDGPHQCSWLQPWDLGHGTRPTRMTVHWTASGGVR